MKAGRAAGVIVAALKNPFFEPLSESEIKPDYLIVASLTYYF